MMNNHRHTRRAITAGVASVSAVAMLVGLAACGGSTAQESKTADGKPIVTILVNKNTNQLPMSEMRWPAELEKEAGVKIVWKEVLDSAWDRQKNASLAAGDISDLNIRAFSPSDAIRNPEAFEDLTDDIDKMPNVKEFFTQKPFARKLVEVDGKIRVLPSDRSKGYLASGQHMMINKQWLDKLGLEIPTTWDELTRVLEAFKTKDPNGNGKQDEIPMHFNQLPTTSVAGWWSPFLFLNSTGIVTHFNSGPSQQGIYVKNGKVGNWMQTDQFREVLDYIASLREKGLVPENWVTLDNSKYNAQLKPGGDVASVGVAFAWDAVAFSPRQTAMFDQYVSMPVPAAPGVSFEETVWDGSREANEFEDYHMAMSANAKNKEACLKIIDLLYSTKYSIQQLYGPMPDYVTYDKATNTYTQTQKFQDAANEQKIPALSDRLAGWVPDDVTIKGDNMMNTMVEADKVYDEQYSHYDHEKDMMPMYVRLNETDTTTTSNLFTGIFDYAMPVIAKFAQDGTTDSAWADFQNKLDSLNIDQTTKIWQAAYDKQVK